MRTASRDELIAAAHRGPSSRASPSGCTAPWTRWARCSARSFALLLVQFARAPALDLRDRRDPGLHQRARHPAPREGAPRRAAARGVPPVAAGLAGLPLAAGRLPALRRRQLERHVHPAQGQLARGAVRHGGRPAERAHPALRALQRRVRGRVAAARRPQRPRRPVPARDRRLRRVRRRVRRVRGGRLVGWCSPSSSPPTASTSPPPKARARPSSAAPSRAASAARPSACTTRPPASPASAPARSAACSGAPSGPGRRSHFGAAAALAAASVMLLGRGKVRRALEA